MVVVDQNLSYSLFLAQMLAAVTHERVRFLLYLAQELRAGPSFEKTDETEYHLDSSYLGDKAHMGLTGTELYRRDQLHRRARHDVA